MGNNRSARLDKASRTAIKQARRFGKAPASSHQQVLVNKNESRKIIGAVHNYRDEFQDRYDYN